MLNNRRDEGEKFDPYRGTNRYNAAPVRRGTVISYRRFVEFRMGVDNNRSGPEVAGFHCSRSLGSLHGLERRTGSGERVLIPARARKPERFWSIASRGLR